MKDTYRSMIPPFLFHALKVWEGNTQLRKWQQQGSPLPPPHIVKQTAIKECYESVGYEVLVETGTYLGEMVEAQKRRFKRVYSIELSEELHARATKRFRRDKQVTIVLGDSGKTLPLIMDQLDKPAIFWLDGHYSDGITARGEKDCPIFEELDAIFSGKPLDHVLLIDDARCFVGQGDYPTIEALTAFVLSKRPHYQLEVKNDIIRYFPTAHSSNHLES